MNNHFIPTWLGEAAAAVIEPLENRCLLSISVINGVLTVADQFRPTPRSIVISTDSSNGDFEVRDNSKIREFPAAGIDSFSIAGGLSTNVIEIDATFPNRITLNLIQGGPGANTILGGTGGQELIFGGNAGDSIVARGPDEFISGGNGADSIAAGPGSETVVAGNGNDTIRGGTGSASINGGAGQDVLIGGSGNDTLTAGSGNSILRAGSGNQELVGGSGTDQLKVKSSTAMDTLVAGTGNSTLIANAGADSIDGSGGGDDLIQAMSGLDTVLGATGEMGMDTILGASGDSITAGRRDIVTPSGIANSTTFSNESIPATANIYGAGHSTPPAPAGSGAGTLPPKFNLPANPLVLTFSSVSGQISLNDGFEDEYNDADDAGSSSNYGYAVGSFPALDGLAGIKAPGQGWLVGVFESNTEPSGTPPASLDFTSIGTNFTSLSPKLNQPFFVGDGLTGDGTGTVQQFIVPAGATRLYLGIADGPGSIGYYFDNSGSFTATFQVSRQAV
jgi:hypothetical protein